MNPSQDPLMPQPAEPSVPEPVQQPTFVPQPAQPTMAQQPAMTPPTLAPVPPSQQPGDAGMAHMGAPTAPVAPPVAPQPPVAQEAPAGNQMGALPTTPVEMPMASAQPPVTSMQPQVQTVAPQAPILPETGVPAATDANLVPQVQTPYNPNGVAKKSISKKLLAIVLGGLAGLALLGVGIWLLVGFLGGQLTLKEYESEYYTVLVPESYEQPSSTSSLQARFTSKTESRGTESGIMVQRQSMGSGGITDELYDMFYDRVESGSGLGEQYVNFVANKTTHKEYRAIAISFDVKSSTDIDAAIIGKGQAMIVFTDDAIYTLMVAIHKDNNDGLDRAKDKIIESFTPKSTADATSDV